MSLRPHRLTIAAAASAALLTFVVSVAPFIGFAYRSPALHVGLETIAGLVGLLAAYLIFGRFRVSARADDLILSFALALFACSNLFLSALPAATPTVFSETFSTWAPAAARLLGAAAFALAAFCPARRVERRRRAVRVALILLVVALAAIAALVAAFAARLPLGIEPSLSPQAPARPVLAGHPVVHALQLVAMALFAAAAIGFVRRAERTGDELLGWLAAASTLAAFARLNYFLFPSLYSEWVYTGDVLRLGFYVLLLAGAAREIGSYQRARAQSVALEERRRLARDLHDGLAQELAYIGLQTRLLVQRSTDGGRLRDELDNVSDAAERALDESRRVIAALTRPIDEPLEVALAEAAEELEQRTGARVELRVSEGMHVTPAVREAVLRVVREAVTDAVRHRGASMIAVELWAQDGLRLRIADDGAAPAQDLERAGGLGLAGARARVRALGGEVQLVSRAGAATTLEVVLR